MSSQITHGMTTNYLPATISTPLRSMSALPVIFGCAPTHRLSAAAQERVKPGTLGMVYTEKQAGEEFGIDVSRDDLGKWTLSAAVFVYFKMFGVGPMVFVNVFDPDKHKETVSSETVSLTAGLGQLAHPDVVGDLVLSPAGGGSAFVEDIDYSLNRVTGVITAIEDGAMVAETEALASYAYAAPEKVTNAECIGGFDIVTKKLTGFGLVNKVFAKYTQVPTIGIAPKFSESPEVAALLAAAMDSVSGLYKKGSALVDIPTEGPNAIVYYADAISYIKENGIKLDSQNVCWPKANVGGVAIPMSLILGARLALTDLEYGGKPYASPSNKSIGISGLLAGGQEVLMDFTEANLLNENGIVTAINHSMGWVLWGNRTAASNAKTSPDEYFICCRRMMGWYGNRLINKWWPKTDAPLRRRLLQTILEMEQYDLDTMKANEEIYGGKIRFLADSNPVTDLISGIGRFHVALGVVSPFELGIFDVEYDESFAASHIATFAA